ncbi:MAG: glycosyltransferase family 2 protein [Candidatus Shapirobacteria bacterium]|jgi:glycosyltransferase involved in cell wall biosynthesis
MKKPTISIAIATYNEADNIKQCLKAVVDWADEIVIYDAESIDDTVKIINTFPKTKLITGPNHPIFHINKQRAIDVCKSDWILQLDADEIVTPELKSEILTTISNNPSENGFWIDRKNYFLGRFLTKGGVYPDPTIRLYRRNKGKLPCKDVHEQARIIGSVGHLKSDLLHYADPSFQRYLMRNNRYTGLIATELESQKVPLNLFFGLNYFLLKPIINFFSTYFRHKGFADGFPGFIFSWYSSLRFPISFIKYWELKNGKTD